MENLKPPDDFIYFCVNCGRQASLQVNPFFDVCLARNRSWFDKKVYFPRPKFQREYYEVWPECPKCGFVEQFYIQEKKMEKLKFKITQIGPVVVIEQLNRNVRIEGNSKKVEVFFEGHANYFFVSQDNFFDFYYDFENDYNTIQLFSGFFNSKANYINSHKFSSEQDASTYIKKFKQFVNAFNNNDIEETLKPRWEEEISYTE